MLRVPKLAGVTPCLRPGSRRVRGWCFQTARLGPQTLLRLHRITESLRLEKTSEVIRSNPQPTTTTTLEEEKTIVVKKIQYAAHANVPAVGKFDSLFPSLVFCRLHSSFCGQYLKMRCYKLEIVRRAFTIILGKRIHCNFSKYLTQ